MSPWIAALVVAAPVAAFAQDVKEKGTLDERFFKAFYQENGLRDFEKAAALYAEVADAARAAKDPGMEVKALLGRARCLKTRDLREAALEALKAVLALEPGNEEANRLQAELGAAASAPAGEDRELISRIQVLVGALGGPERESAQRDLRLIGPRAVPHVEIALASREVGQVKAAAELLLGMATADSLGALERALRDPQVAFPGVLRLVIGSQEIITGVPMVSLVAAGLESADPLERVRTVERLKSQRKRWADIPAEALLPVLRKALADPDLRVRESALSGEWPDSCWEAVIPRVRDLLEDGDDSVRKAAWWSAARAKVVAVALRTELDAGLRSGDAERRRLAFRALYGAGLLLKEAEDAALVSFLNSTDDLQIQEAINALQNRLANNHAVTDPALTRAVLAALRNGATGALSREGVSKVLPLLSWGPPGIQDALPLEEMVDVYAAFPGTGPSQGGVMGSILDRLLVIMHRRTNTDPPARDGLTARGLGAIRDPEGRAYWMWWWVRQGGTGGRKTLRAAVADPLPVIRFIAYDQMVRWPWPKEEARPDMPFLVEDFRSPLRVAQTSPQLQYNATSPHRILALQLAKAWPDPGYAAGLQDVLTEAEKGVESGVASPALRALAACSGKESLPVLRRWVTGQLDTVRGLLVELLGAGAAPDLLRAVELGVPPDTVALNPLPGVSSSLPDPVFAEFMKGLPREKWTPNLVAVAGSSLAGKERDGVVLEAIGSADPRVQEAGAKAAGALAFDGAWPYLVPLLDSPDPEVRTAARGALEVIRSTRDLRAAFERYGEGGPAKALEEAKSLLSHGDPVKRKAGALAVGALGDPAGVPALLALLDDPDAAVRDAVLAALERLGGKPR